MASFLACMLSRLSPPSLGGRHRNLSEILGDVSFSHMKSRIIFVRAFSIVAGIPCARVRNWVRPPTTACMMVFRPRRVGLLRPQRSRSFLIQSRIGSHGVMALVWFPIHTPRERIASPSAAIWTHSFIGSMSSWFIFRVLRTLVL
jgi:hypothetical protein